MRVSLQIWLDGLEIVIFFVFSRHYFTPTYIVVKWTKFGFCSEENDRGIREGVIYLYRSFLLFFSFPFDWKYEDEESGTWIEWYSSPFYLNSSQQKKNFDENSMVRCVFLWICYEIVSWCRYWRSMYVLTLSLSLLLARSLKVLSTKVNILKIWTLQKFCSSFSYWLFYFHK